MLRNKRAMTGRPFFFPFAFPLWDIVHSRLLNKWPVSLQDSDNLWWDAFATEFFEDDATLTLSFCLEDGPKRYSKKEVYFSNTPSFLRHSRKTVGWCWQPDHNTPTPDDALASDWGIVTDGSPSWPWEISFQALNVWALACLVSEANMNQVTR